MLCNILFRLLSLHFHSTLSFMCRIATAKVEIFRSTCLSEQRACVGVGLWAEQISTVKDLEYMDADMIENPDLFLSPVQVGSAQT